jgi:hypothetical protein
VTYESPQALRQALAAHARQAARDTDASSSDLITRFYLGRLLARVFHADPDAWLLKGGQALLVRYPDARHSRDIDLCRTSVTTTLDDAVATLIRYRDLVDLLLIAHREPLDGPLLRLVLRTEVGRRRARGTVLELPSTFTIPGRNWPAGYRAIAAKVAGLADYRTIEQAAALAHILLDPLLDADDPPQRWNPRQLRWD